MQAGDQPWKGEEDEYGFGHFCWKFLYGNQVGDPLGIWVEKKVMGSI